MNGTRAGYYEFLRTRLGITTPRQQWQLRLDLGEEASVVGPPPPLGAQPSWDLQITNSMLQSAIESACNTVIRECRVKNAASFTDIPIAAQTANGPYTFNLSTIPGFRERDVVTIRRSYWFDGTTYWRVDPVLLSVLDVQGTDYLNQGPATLPFQIAVEGDVVYILPGPQAAGTLRLTVGSGALAPLTDLDGFDGLPASYDDAILYVSLVELALMLTANQEMQQRAQAFAPFAVKGLQELTAWYDNVSLDEFEASSWFKTGVIRYSRRS